MYAAKWLMVCAAMVPGVGAARSSPEGFWLGTTGNEKERIEVGLEIRHDASGQAVMKLTEPNMGYYGIDAGATTIEGDRVQNAGFMLDLRAQGDTLEGTFPGPRAQARLRRVEALPQPPALPDVPTGPAPRWQTRLSGQAYASPVVADGVAYIGTTGGVFNAVQAGDGAIAWTFAVGAPIYGAAAIDGDALYFVSDAGFLHKLARADGKERWRYDLGDRGTPRILPHPSAGDWDWQAPRPLVADGVVYVGAGDGGFHAVDAATGTRKWRFASGSKIRNGAALDGPRVVFGSADHFVYALERADGREAWRFDSKAEIDGAPLVHGGHVFVGNRGPGLHSLAAASGKEEWRLFFWGSWVESTPVVDEGVLYIGSSDLGHVSAIDPANGHVLWRGNAWGWTFGTPLLTTDRVYAGAAGGAPYSIRHDAGFVSFERRTGKLLTRWPIADGGGHQWGIAGSPARSGDLVIVATIAGSLLAFPLGG
ncbi:MAG: outer membrane protein assembly factor BamB family protein [Dokdonella sp.]|uniref:outer membrane protein assembly factor BamB family protein n=1 Tax=Dokdonella sp. TaxID=2291710 RepID=UPI003F7F055E